MMNGEKNRPKPGQNPPSPRYLGSHTDVDTEDTGARTTLTVMMIVAAMPFVGIALMFLWMVLKLVLGG